MMRVYASTVALYALLVGRGSADDCSTTVTVTTATPAMASCATFSGDVVIASTLSGDVNLASVEIISGRVVATGVPNLESISLPVLISADGIEVTDAPLFNSFEFSDDASAAHVSLGNVDFSNLPAFPGFNFGYLDGLSNMTYTNVSSDWLSFEWAAPDVDMGALVIADNAILANASVPFASAEEISVANNDVITSLGFDYMTGIAAATITANPSMTSVYFPSLTAVAGDFIVHASHDVYLDLSSNLLASVGGNMELTGDIAWSFADDIAINGTVTIKYDADAGDQYKCAEITPGVMTITCNGEVLSATATGTGGTVTVTAGVSNHTVSSKTNSHGAATGTASSSSSSGLSSTAKIGIGLGVALGVIGIVAIIAAILLLLRLRKKRASSRDGSLVGAAGPGVGPGGSQGGAGWAGAPGGEKKLPPPYAGIWRSFSTKNKQQQQQQQQQQHPGVDAAEPMMPAADGHGNVMMTQQQQQQPHVPQELQGNQAFLPTGAPAQGQGQPQRHAAAEMEGDQNWRRSELMG